MNSFNFNGKSTEDFSLYVSNKDIYSLPARDIKLTSVSGRNGDIVIDNNRYENITVSYTIGIKNISTKIKSIKLWLSQSGYFKLYDTYQPDYYRLACFNGGLKVTEQLNNIGTAVISFSCKPFMYSILGDEVIPLGSSGTITNPEQFSSLPHIRIYGSGNITLYINNKSYNITNIDEYVDIDSEMMACYKGDTLMNNNINFVEFPTLESGENNISATGSVTKIEVVPHWRTL